MRHKISIYLDDRELHHRIKAISAVKGITISEYCRQAILDKLARETLDRREFLRQVAHRMDERRRRNAPVGAPTWKLVEEGRSR